ncbi:MAG: DNA-directed DNA polymerase, partial [Desertifilum sp. SIO1I2]|nr:DNA-directed DNA polymerase [Desertifilum sp. SIO1I2]
TSDAQFAHHQHRLTESAVLGVDVETTGLDPKSDRIRLVQLATPNQPTLVIDLWQMTNWKPLADLLILPSILKVGHNLKFDWQMLKVANLPLARPFFDTQLAYQVLRKGIPNKSDLGYLVKRLLKVNLDKSQQCSNFSQPQLSLEQLQYAAWDAAYSLALSEVLRERLGHARLWAIAQLEFDCIPATASMELNGMYLDPTRWQNACTTLEKQKQEASNKFHSSLLIDRSVQMALWPEQNPTLQYGINLNSSQQVQRALARAGLELKSTDQRSIIKVVERHPALPALLEWRRVSKVLDILNGLPKHRHRLTQRLHPQIFQIGARSGRFSCRNPALQTIPHQDLIRRCFTAPDGFVLIKADYSQIELRIIAKITKDPLLVKAYRTAQDVHRLTAALLMDKPVSLVTEEERRLGKAINFGLIYGMSAVRLQIEAQLKYGIILTNAQALHLHKRYFKLFKGVRLWHQRLKRRLYTDRVKHAPTLLGRVRRWQEQPKFNEWLNFPVQGTSADITKQALVNLLPCLNPDCVKLLIAVHDEIVLEVRSDLADTVARQLQQAMIDAAVPLLSPIPVEVNVCVGSSWAGQ